MTEIKPNGQALLAFLNRKAFRDNISFYTRSITCDKENGVTIPFTSCAECDSKCDRYKQFTAVLERFSAQNKK